MSTPRTVIIGAGIAGLATAALLAQEGHEVHVLERLGRVGGRTGEITDGGFRFETGPSWYLMPEVFEHYFALLGAEVDAHLDLRMLDPGYRVYSQPQSPGAPADAFEVPTGAAAVEAAFDQREPGSARLLRRYLDSGDRALEMAMRFFLYNTFTSPRFLAHPAVLRALPQLLPLLTTSLQARAHAMVDDTVLRQVLGYPAVFLGSAPATAPSMYHLMSTLDLRDGVRYPMGGFSSIVRALENLARERGAQITLGAEVTGIDTSTTAATRGRVRGVTYRLDDESHHLGAEHVVSAADLHHTETALLPPHLRTYPERWWRTRTSGPGAVLVMLGVRGELPQLAHHSLFFTRDWEKNFEAIFGANPTLPTPASAYVCKPSATDPGVAPEGHENLFVLVPVPPNPTIGTGGRDGGGDTTVEAAADRIIDQIATWADIPDLRERIVTRHTLGPADFLNDYHSWSGGMLGQGHILVQSAMFREANTSRRVQGLYYAGATTRPGVGVPMCLISAELVLKHMRGDRSPGPLRTPSNAGGTR